MGEWIDFKKLREELDVMEVLKLYGVEVKRKGTQVQGFCPLPNHQGNKRSPSFSVSLQKKIFQCFGCGAKGNLLELVTLLEKLDPANPHDLRRAAILLQEKRGKSASPKPISESVATSVHLPATYVKAATLPVAVNAPLDFELRNLDERPQYLLGRGFTPETIKHFGLGYCSKGLFAGRVVIPLHDPHGRLIGYAGRIIFDEAIDEANPKYLFPSKRERNGTLFEFAKSLFLYNGHRLKKPVDDLLVVEGFPSVWWLTQHGYKNTVGLMGASCSADQASLIVNLTTPNGRVWHFSDLDEAGIRCTQSVLMQVASERCCRWIKSSSGTQPTNCTSEELKTLLPNLKSAN